MGCSICDGIPPYVWVNTGREEYFEAPVTSLVQVGDDHWRDLRECPECGNLYSYYDDSSQSGSGNNDGESITRLDAPVAAIVRAFVRRRERGIAIEDVLAHTSGFAGLPDELRNVTIAHLVYRDRDLACALMFRLLETAEAAPPRWMLDFIEKVVTATEARRVLDGPLSRLPSSAEVDKLRAHCKQLVCTICRPIPRTAESPLPPPSRERLSTPYDALVRLDASETIDIWECPECASLFLWSWDGTSTEGRLRVLRGYQAAPVRECIHRSGPVSSYAREMVFASDGHRTLEAVLRHAFRRDRELVIQFLPRMIQALAQNQLEWLRDLLCDFAETPADADLVLDAIAKAGRSHPLVRSVAEHCWQLSLP